MKRLAVLLACLTAVAVPASASASGAPPDVYGPRHHPVGRIVLLHGMSGNREFVRTQPFARLLFHLTRQRWQVVVPNLPYAIGQGQAQQLVRVFAADQSAGATYAAVWRRRFERIVSWSDRHLGRARRLYVGGVSWGGFHAMLAACMDPRVSGYFVHTPVVDPRALVEFRSSPLAALTLQFGCARRLAARPGYIAFGGADTRVGVAPVQRLVTRLRADHAPLTVHDFPTLDHSTTLASVDAMLRWSRAQALRR